VFASCDAHVRGRGHIAALKCTSAVPGVVDELLARRYAEARTMAAAFETASADYDRLPCKDFAGGPAGAGHRSTWGSEGAGLACFVNVPGDAVVLWEHPEQRVQLFAIDLQDDSPALFAWWQQHGQVPLVVP